MKLQESSVASKRSLWLLAAVVIIAAVALMIVLMPEAAIQNQQEATDAIVNMSSNIDDISRILDGISQSLG